MYAQDTEWGAISEPAGYRALKSIDSYPAVLLTTGVTDPRVASFHVGKMTARLQAATASGKPILLRVDFDAGHGIDCTRHQQGEAAADARPDVEPACFGHCLAALVRSGG